MLLKRDLHHSRARSTRRFVAALAALLIALALGKVVWAHPADMFLHSHKIHLTPSGVQVEWAIYPGPLLTYAVWSQADQDQDEVVIPPEAEAWVKAGLPQLSAVLDETRPLEWQVESIEWPTSPEALQLGDEKIVVQLSADWPPGLGGSHRLELHNRYEEPISASWFYLHGAEGVAFHTPDQENGLIRLDFVIPDDPGDTSEGLQDYWDSGVPTLPSGSEDSPPTAPQDRRPSAILTGLVRTPQLSPPFYLAALGIALALGAVHALTPGHGKALVAAYLVGSRGTMRHAAVLGLIVTLTHTGSVLALGGLTLIASRALMPTALFPILEIASGLLIVAMGVGLILRRWRGLRGVLAARAAGARRREGPAESGTRIYIRQDIPTRVYDGLLPAEDLSLGSINWRSLVALGVSGGLVPCPDAIAILLIAITISRIVLGLSLIVAFSLGLATVLIAIGMATVRGRRLLDRFDWFGRLAPALPLVSAMAVLGLGLALTIVAAIRGGPLVQPLAATETASPSGGVPWQGSAPTPTLKPLRAEQAGILYMAADANRAYQLFVVPLAGGEPSQLTRETTGVIDYTVSPDGATVVYSVARQAGGGDLWAVNTDGSDRRQILACPEAACRGAMWSPNGERIVYERLDMSSRGAVTETSSLWWLDPSTGETGPVFQDSQLPGFGPGWSPDGRWLSYVSPGAGGVQVYNLTEGQSRSIATQSGGPVVWSPDGDALLVMDIRSQGEQFLTHLIRYEIESGELADLSSEGVDDRSASWSPTGEWIAVVRREATELNSSPGDQIWLMRPDGSEAYPLTAAPDVLHGTPIWSPDGRYLLFQRYLLSEVPVQAGVWILEVEAGDLQEVITPGYWPTWVPSP